MDLTPPTTGIVHDGLTPGEDIKYSSRPSTVDANWEGFEDPESGIYSQTLHIYVNGQLEEVY